MSSQTIVDRLLFYASIKSKKKQQYHDIKKDISY